MSAGNADNVAISPVDLIWRIESEFCVDYTGITAASLDAKYFTFNSAKDATSYYLWHDLDASSVDPTPGGTGVEADISTGDSATVIAAAVAAAIDAEGDFEASSSGAVVTVKNVAVGASTDAADVDTNAAIQTIREGKDENMGLIQDTTELTLSPSLFDIQAMQFGETILGSIQKGFEEVTASSVLLETQRADLERIYSLYGGNNAAIGALRLSGAGTSQNGVNLLKRAARLVFKPVGAANDEDNIWMALAIPVPSSLVFSGVDPRTLAVDWRGFADTRINTNYNVVGIGDDNLDLS